jgi:GTP-binding protein
MVPCDLGYYRIDRAKLCPPFTTPLDAGLLARHKGRIPHAAGSTTPMPSTSPEQEAENARLLEKGRKLFAGEWRFMMGAVKVEQLPFMEGVEIGLVGRSNVGKSSLVNALTGRKTLAKVSNTPGRTQELNFFRLGESLTIVDMPGYGFAKAPEPKVRAWTHLIHNYLKGRANLARIYVLIDARHGIKETDEPIFKTMDANAVSFQVILTKTDQLRADEREQRIVETAQKLMKHAAAHPHVLATSSRSADGIAELRAAIVALMEERGA